jgi:lambda family phage minor tail protein L
MEGVRLPAGRIEHNYCPHIYGPDRTSNDPVRCSWDNTAGPWFDADDQSVGTIGEDACGFRYTSCKARFTSIGKPLDFGGYPGIERIAQPGSRK